VNHYQSVPPPIYPLPAKRKGNSMEEYIVKLHLTIKARDAKHAREIAVTLGEALADATVELESPGSLVVSCVDNEDEIEEAGR
jgi:hypothetical protein